jgi:hypothetical protein
MWFDINNGLDTPAFWQRSCGPKGQGIKKAYPNTPSINNNTKPLSFDIKPLCSDKFICGLIQKSLCFIWWFDANNGL